MSHENITALPSPLDSLKYQFEQWRKTRKNRRERIPELLWSAAVGLRNQYSVNQISHIIRHFKLDLTLVKPIKSLLLEQKLTKNKHY